MSKSFVSGLFVTSAFTLLTAVPLSAQTNILNNEKFTNRAQLHTVQLRSCSDASAADNWNGWIQAIGCVEDSGVRLETDIAPASLPSSAGTPDHFIHVRIERLDPLKMGDPIGSGITQEFNTKGPFYNRVLVSVWVYVVRGEVGLSAGYTGTTTPNARSTKLGQWEQIVTLNTSDPVTQFVLSSTSPAGAEFYAADPTVCAAETDQDLEACRVSFAPNAQIRAQKNP